MERPLTIAHCADLHLDSDYYEGGGDLWQRDRGRRIVARLLRAVAGRGPDLLLIAGDLFDSNRASAGTIAWLLDELAALSCTVVMIPGNHDCLARGSIYHRHNFNAPRNCHLLQRESGCELLLHELKASIGARPMVAHTPDYRPLQGLPAGSRADYWQIAMAHGLHVTGKPDPTLASPISSREIAALTHHYLALGHHHGALDASAGATVAWYSGSPAPVGPEPGSYLWVTLRPGRDAEVTLVPLWPSD